jgi:hypothetical protein
MDRIALRPVLWLWVAILVGISVRVLVAPKAHSVYAIMSDAGRMWLAGECVYDSPPDRDHDEYRYSPAVAAAFAGFTHIPDRYGGVVWRWVNVAAFFAALAAWVRWRGRGEQLATALLLVLPLSVGGLNNGQCNALVAGLTMAATVAFARGRWAVAAAAVTAATLFKGYPVSLGLLFCLVEPRRFAPRLAAALLIGLALPYLVQRPDYVTAQYAKFLKVLRDDDRTAFPVYHGYRDLHMLARLAGWQMSQPTYRGLEAALGTACAAVIVAGRRRGWDAGTATAACYSLAMCWMTLCGPTTESCTYVLIAPVLALAVIRVGERPWPQRILVGASYVLFTASAMTAWFPHGISRPVQSSGIQPLAALLLTVRVVTAVCGRLRQLAVAGEEPPQGRERAA